MTRDVPDPLMEVVAELKDVVAPEDGLFDVLTDVLDPLIVVVDLVDVAVGSLMSVSEEVPLEVTPDVVAPEDVLSVDGPVGRLVGVLACGLVDSLTDEVVAIDVLAVGVLADVLVDMADPLVGVVLDVPVDALVDSLVAVPADTLE